MAVKGAFSGKRAWVVSSKALKAKLVDCGLYTGVFGGVVISARSLVNLEDFYIFFFLGLLLTPTTMLLRDKNSGVKQGNIWFKKFLFYFLSTVGLVLTLGLVTEIAVLGHVKYSGYYLLAGLVITFLSRYNLKKHRVLGIIEDYVMYFGSFLFVYLMVIGFMHMSPATTILLVLLGSLLVPLLLIGREKTIFKRPEKHPVMKYWSMVVVTFGLGACLFGVICLLSGSLLAGAFLLEGFMIMLAGSLMMPTVNLVTLKDIV